MSDLLSTYARLMWCEAAHDLADDLAIADGFSPDVLTGDEYSTFHDEADTRLEEAAASVGLTITDRNDTIPLTN